MGDISHTTIYSEDIYHIKWKNTSTDIAKIIS